MKKVILSAALVALTGLTYAQKPTAGDVTGEVELRFQTGGDYVHVLSPNLNARYFLQDDLALRLSLGVNTSSTSNDFTENADGTGGSGTYETSSSNFGIGVGIEKHFAGTERLSPYIGAGINFSTGSSSQTGTNSDGTMYMASYSKKVDGPSSSSFGIGVNAGADYYFVNNIYLGIEVGLGFSTGSLGKSTTTETSGGVTVTSISQGGSNSGISVGPNTGLRLGLIF